MIGRQPNERQWKKLSKLLLMIPAKASSPSQMLQVHHLPPPTAPLFRLTPSCLCFSNPSTFDHSERYKNNRTKATPPFTNSKYDEINAKDVTLLKNND